MHSRAGRFRLRPPHRWKLGTRISVAVGGLMTVSTLILAVIAVVYVAKLGSHLESNRRDTLLPYQIAQQVNNAIDDTEVALLATLTSAPSKREQLRTSINASRSIIAAGLATYRRELNPASQPAMRARLKSYGVPDTEITREENTLDALRSEIPRLNALVDTVLQLTKSGKETAAHAIYEERGAASFNRALSATSVLMTIQVEESVKAGAAGRLERVDTERSVAISMIVALLLAIVTVQWLTRHITRPLKELVLGANTVTLGDFTQRVVPTTHDEIGELANAFNQMVATLGAERIRAQRYLDHAAVILLALDSKGRILLANRHACAVFGWTEQELAGRSFISTLVPPDLREVSTARQAALLAGPDASVIESAIVTRQGKIRLVEWRSTLIRDPDGTVVSIFTSGTDITERKEAEEALRVAEERARFALESAGIGIWDVDYGTGSVTWSPILERQFGLEPGQYPRTLDAFADLVHADDRETMLATMASAAASGADFTYNHRAAAPDGTIRWLSGSGRVHLDENGNALRGLGISMDVTARRLLEMHTQQAQKMEAVGRLASGVAHDFNNLLTVILGFADLMATDAQAKGNRSDLAEIIKAANRATVLTKQLLAFGRQQTLTIVPVDINELIEGMTGMFERLLGEDVSLTLSLHPVSCHALADKGQIEQVLTNLAVNAADAMPDGGTMTIQTSLIELAHSRARDEPVTPGEYVLMSITDTGIGMTTDTQRRLFEPFFTTKAEGHGTGLGLATAYGIVKQSKGYIWVRSAAGEGTTFEVYLPCSKVPAAPRAKALSPQRSRAATESVLLVEDQDGVRALTRRVLDNAGYSVLEAANAASAQKIFSENSEAISVIVSDVVMPGLDGVRLIARLREIKPNLAAVLMSGFREISEDTLALENDCCFIQKPFVGGALLDVVLAALESRCESYPDAAASPA